jgi:hypothetical protein
MRDLINGATPGTKKKTGDLLDKKYPEQLKTQNLNAERPTPVRLTITIYKLSTTSPAGVAKCDSIYWSGIFTLIVQLGIAAIPKRFLQLA